MSKPWLALGPASFSSVEADWSGHTMTNWKPSRCEVCKKSQLLLSDPKSSVSKTFAAYDNIGADAFQS